MSYAVLADALARAKERAGAKSSDDQFLTELLTLSAGVDPQGETQYRPFYCAAKWLEQNKSTQYLSKAKGGTEFTNMATPIASLLDLQASLDKSLGLAVPEGFEAISPDCKGCSNTPRYRSRSSSTVARP